MIIKHIPKTPGIYCIEFTPDGRKYIGSSKNMYVRLCAHRSRLKKGSHPNPILQAHFNKYGASSFVVCVIEALSDCDQLVLREQHWIDNLGTVANGFNILPDASSTRGHQHSDEWKKNKSTQMLGSLNPFYGQHHTRETIEHLSEIRKGKRTGTDNPFHGKIHTEEAREKIRVAAKNRSTNPFSGRSWSDPELEEALCAMRRKLSDRFSGEANPFYGHKHDRTLLGAQYRITDPEGKIVVIRNLRLWCEENNRRFEVMRSSWRFDRQTPDGWLVEKL